MLSCIAQQPNALSVTTQRALCCCKRSNAAPYSTVATPGRCLLSWRWAAFMHFLNACQCKIELNIKKTHLMWSSSCCAGSGGGFGIASSWACRLRYQLKHICSRTHTQNAYLPVRRRRAVPANDVLGHEAAKQGLFENNNINKQNEK